MSSNQINRALKSSFSPFAHVLGRGPFPHSRTLRTSFWQKMKDTYNALSGESFLQIEPQKKHLGLLDYLPPIGFLSATLYFLPLAVDEKLDDYLKKTSSSLLRSAIYLALAVNFVVAMAPLAIFAANRMVMCLAAIPLTIAFTGFVLIAHGVSKLFAASKAKRADALEFNATATSLAKDKRMPSTLTYSKLQNAFFELCVPEIKGTTRNEFKLTLCVKPASVDVTESEGQMEFYETNFLKKNDARVIAMAELDERTAVTLDQFDYFTPTTPRAA